MVPMWSQAQEKLEQQEIADPHWQQQSVPSRDNHIQESSRRVTPLRVSSLLSFVSGRMLSAACNNNPISKCYHWRHILFNIRSLEPSEQRQLLNYTFKDEDSLHPSIPLPLAWALISDSHPFGKQDGTPSKASHTDTVTSRRKDNLLFCVCFLLTVRKPLPEAPATLLSHLDHSCTKCSSPNQWPASDESLPWGPRKGWYRCGCNSIRKEERDALGMNHSTVTSRCPCSWHCPIPLYQKDLCHCLCLTSLFSSLFRHWKFSSSTGLTWKASQLLWGWVVSCFNQYSFLSWVLHHCFYALQCPPSVLSAKWLCLSQTRPWASWKRHYDWLMSQSQRVQLSTSCYAPGHLSPPELCIK